MDKKLKSLFDFQRFEGNARLAKLIEETESAYGIGRELADEELEFLAAAGELQPATNVGNEIGKNESR